MVRACGAWLALTLSSVAAGQPVHPVIPEPPGCPPNVLEWWPYFGAGPDPTGGAGDPCAGVGSVVYLDDGSNGSNGGTAGDGVPDAYRWQASAAVAGYDLGGWHDIARVHDDNVLDSWNLAGLWGRLSLPNNTPRNISAFYRPVPGDFLNPAETLGASSFALVPYARAGLSTDWQGTHRPVLEGVVDLVTGAPLVHVVDLTLPFGGAEFRLSRTRSAVDHLGDALGPNEQAEAFPQPRDADRLPTDRWWDWAGEGWMVGENPLLVIDSAIANVVGDGPRTTWFVPDAHHSIPFQLIESNGTYEAPPRFRATLEHDGVWDPAQRAWSTPPTTYTVRLYEGALSYTFVPIREDVPGNVWDQGVLNNPSLNDPAAPSSFHDRPLTGLFTDNPLGTFNPMQSFQNPGFGIPYLGVCVRIEDDFGHRADIYYADTPTGRLVEPGDPGEPDGCAECWQDAARKGQINAIKLRAPTDAGYATEWTLLYAHRRFRGATLTSTERRGGGGAAAVNERSDDLRVLPDKITWDANGNSNTAHVWPDDYFLGEYPESGATAFLYALRGTLAIDRIYVFEGDVSASLLDGAQLTIGHLERPQLNGGADPLEAHNIANPGSAIPTTDLLYTVRYHYEYDSTPTSDPTTGDGANLSIPLLVKTTVETTGIGRTDARTFHYRTSDGSDDHEDFGKATDLSLPDGDNPPWLELVFEAHDIAEVREQLGLTIDELARWRRADPGVNPGDLTFDADTGVDAEAVRAFASLRLNAAPVDDASVRADTNPGWPADGVSSSQLRWAKPDLASLWNAQLDAGPYLVNARHEVVLDEPAGDILGQGYDEANARVAMVSVRRDDGTMGHHALHKLLQTQKSYAPPGVGFDYAAAFNGRAVRHPSIYAAPYRWAAFPEFNGQNYGPWTDLGANGPWDEPEYWSSGDLSRVRWITMVDTFDDRVSMTDDQADYVDAVKAGMTGRQIVEMNPAGYVLRDRSWVYTTDGVDTDASGLGEEYIYQLAKDYFGAALPDSNDADTSTIDADQDGIHDVTGEPLSGWATSNDALRHEMLLVEQRSIGWSAGERMSPPQGDDKGLVSFYEYGLYGMGTSTVPWSQRIQMTAAGIKRGRAHTQGGAPTGPSSDFFAAGQSAGGGPRLYQRQFVRDASGNGNPSTEERPWEITAEVEFLTPATATLTSIPAPGAAPSSAVAIKHIVTSYDDLSDPDRITSRLIVGPGRQTEPGVSAPYLFPVEREQYDACGNATWSFTGFVTDPTSPLTGPAHRDQILTATLYIRDSRGRSRATVLDADPGLSSFTAVYDPGDPGDNRTFSIGSGDFTGPDSGWGRLGTSAPLNAVTSFVYDGTTQMLEDIFYEPQQRRWARRLVVWSEYDGMTLLGKRYRDYVFPELRYVGVALNGSGGYSHSRYVAVQPGQLSELPLNDLNPYAQPETTRVVEYRTGPAADPAEIRLDFTQDESPPPFVEQSRLSYTIDANGRVIGADLAEMGSDGQLGAPNSKEVNDLGEVFRERDFDGTTTRLTRNHLGQTLRTYVGTDDTGWADLAQGGPGGVGFDMQLIERIAYGAGIHDAWKPTITRRYRSTPAWAQSRFYDAPGASDGAYVAEVTGYDWRGRAVRVDVYDGADPATATRLSTTLTYLDHADRPVLTASYGAGTLTVPTNLDPEKLDDADALPGAADLYGLGVRPIEVVERVYDNAGNAFETRAYDVAWDHTGGGSPEYLATYRYVGHGDTVVYQQSAHAPLTLTRLDNVARVASEIVADGSLVSGGVHYQTVRTDHTYDGDGNVIDTGTYTRVVDTSGLGTGYELDADPAGTPNAVRTRTVYWYDAQKRVVAEAELGTENTQGWVASAASFDRLAATTAPSWDAVAGVDRAGLPDTARLWITAYDPVTGQVARTVDPGGMVTEYGYDRAGRLSKMVENASGDPAVLDRSRETHYTYQFGRLVEMAVPRLTYAYESGVSPYTFDPPSGPAEATRIVYEAEIVAPDGLGGYDVVSAHNGLVGAVYMRRDDQTASDWWVGAAPDIRLRYTFDGQIAERIDARGVGFQYFYDALGRVESIKVARYNASGVYQGTGYPSGHWDPASAPLGDDLPVYLWFAYDDRGNLTRARAFSAVPGDPATDTSALVVADIERAFDDRDNLSEEWQALQASVDRMTSPSVAYGWAYAGTVAGSDPGHHRLASMTYPVAGGSTKQVRVGYGAAGSYEDLISTVMDVAVWDGVTKLHDVASYVRAGDGRRMRTTAADGEIVQDFRASTPGLFTGLPRLDQFGAVANLRFDDSTGARLYQGQQTYDARGFLATKRLRQQPVGGSTGNNERSSIYGYDGLGRLTRMDVGELVFSAPTGTPELVSGTEQRQDSWALDSVGNWAGLENVVGDWNGDTRADNFDVSAFLADFNATPPDPRTDLNGDTLFTQADVDAFLDAVDFGRTPGRQSIGNLDGYGTPWALSNAAAGVDTHEYNQAVGITNEIEEVIEYGSGLGGPIAHAYDAAGNLRFDGTYVYQYDAWNRLVQVNQASWDAQAGAPVVGALVKRWVYDAFGRVVQTRSPITGGEYEERFVYDGIRRVQEWVTDTSVVSPTELLERAYVWGFGGGTDELLVEFDGFGTSYWPIQDVSGDVVALCDLNGANGTARVVGQWTYDAYGEVLTAEHIGSFPVRHVGHKGLFVDRLDGVILSSSTEQPRTIPFAHVVYQNRNRAYMPRSGRFLQRDPNQTAMQLLGGSYNGRGTTAIALAFSFEGMYGDGFNLYQYLGGNPLLRRDPMGLSYDPFDMLDDFMAEYLGSASAFLSQLGQDVQAAAVVGLNVLSMMPFPGVSIVGDVGLYLAGEQGLAMTVGMIALGLVPGGKLIGKAVGKVGPVIADIGAKAWRYSKQYAMQFGGAILRGGAQLGQWTGGLIGTLASRAKNFVDNLRKPPLACGCFTAGTLVWTASGAVPIGELSEGDVVMAAPDDGSALDYAQASIGTKIVIGEASLVLLTVRHDDGSIETIETTDEHPFYDKHRGWTRADGLRPGDPLASVTGEAIVVSIGYDGWRVPVFNLSIPGSPTYYVGEGKLWVHNCNPQRDYRKMFLSVRPLPDGYDVHHRLPRRYRSLFPGGEVDKMANWAGVDRLIHVDINKEWSVFARSNPAPTAEEVRSFANRVDAMFMHHYILPE